MGEKNMLNIGGLSNQAKLNYEDQIQKGTNERIYGHAGISDAEGRERMRQRSKLIPGVVCLVPQKGVDAVGGGMVEPWGRRVQDQASGTC